MERSIAYVLFSAESLVGTRIRPTPCFTARRSSSVSIFPVSLAGKKPRHGILLDNGARYKPRMLFRRSHDEVRFGLQAVQRLRPEVVTKLENKKGNAPAAFETMKIVPLLFAVVSLSFLASRAPAATLDANFRLTFHGTCMGIKPNTLTRRGPFITWAAVGELSQGVLWNANKSLPSELANCPGTRSANVTANSATLNFQYKCNGSSFYQRLQVNLTGPEACDVTYTDNKTSCRSASCRIQ